MSLGLVAAPIKAASTTSQLHESINPYVSFPSPASVHRLCLPDLPPHLHPELTVSLEEHGDRDSQANTKQIGSNR